MLAIGLVIGLAGPLLFPAHALAQKTGEAAWVQGSKKLKEKIIKIIKKRN